LKPTRLEQSTNKTVNSFSKKTWKTGMGYDFFRKQEQKHTFKIPFFFTKLRGLGPLKVVCFCFRTEKKNLELQCGWMGRTQKNINKTFFDDAPLLSLNLKKL